MTSTTMLHLPQAGDPYPLVVRSDVVATSAASLTLEVLAGDTLHIFTYDPAHLRQIATVAAELADRLEATQVAEAISS